MTVTGKSVPVDGSRTVRGTGSKVPSSRKNPVSWKSGRTPKPQLSRRGATKASTTASPGSAETASQTSRAVP